MNTVYVIVGASWTSESPAETPHYAAYSCPVSAKAAMNRYLKKMDKQGRMARCSFPQKLEVLP